VARLLIVGGGCRGLRLAEEAVREGHAVRIVTRTEDGRAQIEAAGAECWIGDPNRLGTLRGVLDGVTIACWLLGGATGPEEQLLALHGARLRAFLESAIDTTVRGVVYEAVGSSMPTDASMPAGSSMPTDASMPAGSSMPGALAEGERVAREMAHRNSIPLAILHADPADMPLWLEQARGALTSLLAP
jgi:nucleoside-diphosphate-sugar epimerase